MFGGKSLGHIDGIACILVVVDEFPSKKNMYVQF